MIAPKSTIQGMKLQFAAAMGIRTVGSAGSAKGLELALREGATEAVDHRASGYREAAMSFTGGKGFDVILAQDEEFASRFRELGARKVQTVGSLKADAPPLTPPQVAFSDVPDILVNIQSNDGTPAYLKLSLSLEMDNDLEKAGITALTPRLVDQFQSYLRELRVDDLKGSEGVLRLKEELLRRVNAASAPYHVRDVLLKQMIVQ